MSQTRSLFATWRHALAFWCGSVMVSIGVLLHVPMLWMGRNTGYRLAGMPMGTGMYVGMALIVLGVIAAGYGLRPRRGSERVIYGSVAPPEDAPLTQAHWIQMGLLALALVIDVMKAATLGFVTPGMRLEYGLDRATIALLPFVALIGTAVAVSTTAA